MAVSTVFLSTSCCRTCAEKEGPPDSYMEPEKAAEVAAVRKVIDEIVNSFRVGDARAVYDRLSARKRASATYDQFLKEFNAVGVENWNQFFSSYKVVQIAVERNRSTNEYWVATALMTNPDIGVPQKLMFLKEEGGWKYDFDN